MENNTNSSVSEKNFQKYEIYVGTQNQNTAFEQYGHVTAPVYVRKGDNGGMVKQPNVDFWTHNDEFQKFLPGGYAFLPHEPVEEKIQHIIGVELKDENLYLARTEIAHKGYTKYWKVLTEENFTVDEATNDKVKLGFVVRNGISTGVALGVDLFTFRLICENGAVARGKNLESYSIRHVGQIPKLLKVFRDNIEAAMINAKELIRYYRRATQIKVNNELANVMYQRLSDLGEMYLPPWWDIKNKEDLEFIKKQGQFRGNMNLITVKKTVSLWETFNEITQQQRDRLHQNLFGVSLILYQHS